MKTADSVFINSYNSKVKARETNVEQGRLNPRRPLACVLRSWRDLRGLNSLKLSSRPHDAQTASAQADLS